MRYPEISGAKQAGLFIAGSTFPGPRPPEGCATPVPKGKGFYGARDIYRESRMPFNGFRGDAGIIFGQEHLFRLLVKGILM